jgi:translation initiation factor eIF-2B subunit beta
MSNTTPDNDPNDHAPSTWESTTQFEWISSLDSTFDQFLWRLKRRDLTSSSQWAQDTLSLFRKYLIAASAEQYNTTVGDMIILFRQMGLVLVDARPIELVVGNITRRVLHTIRHEAILKSVYQNQERKGDQDVILESIHPLLNPIFGREQNYYKILLKDIIETIDTNFNEFRDDIEITDKNVSKTATTHIFPNEIILTYGFSRTLLSFLKRARVHRNFQVFVAESNPTLSGRKFAALLAQANIDVTLIPDSDIFSIMPVVTKVFIGAHAVLANGGLIGMIGANNLCLAAATAQIPVVVLCGVHKISPVYAFDQETLNEFNSPAQILPFDDCLEGRIDVVNPAFDYVSPEFVSLFITDAGTYPPSCIYRQLSDLYSSEDYALESIE